MSLGSFETLAIDPALASMLRLFLAAIFAEASIHKLRDRQRFHATLLAYRLPLGPLERLRVPLSRWIAATLPAVEFSLAISLIASASSISAGLAVSLLFFYSAAIGINLARGRIDLDCGCSGPATRQPIGRGLIVRNGMLMAIAGISALPASGRVLVWLDAFPILAGALGLVILSAGVDTAMRNARQQRVFAQGGAA